MAAFNACELNDPQRATDLLSRVQTLKNEINIMHSSRARVILPHPIPGASLRVLIGRDDAQELQPLAYASLNKEGLGKMCPWQKHSLS